MTGTNSIDTTSSTTSSTFRMAVKPTKAPSMSENTAYCDWKKEVMIWQLTNTPLGCSKTVMAGTLFESLHGQARETILSSLKIEQICAEDGIDNMHVG